MDTVSHLAPAASTAPRFRPPTILDYIGRRVTPKCSECGNDIAVRWVPRAWETSELDAWADHEDVLFNRCHVCALKAAPVAYHATLKARFDHILQVHDRLSFHAWQPSRSGSLRPTPVTTTYTTWYPVNRAGPSDPYVEEFCIAGYLLDEFDAEATGRVLSPSPPYHIYPHEEPSGSGLRTLVAAVYVTLHVRLPAVPDAYLEWRWDPYDRALAWEPMIRGFSRVSADEIQRLAYHGRRLFAIHRTSRGRIPVPVDAEKYIDLAEAFIKERGRAPHSWAEFAAFVDEKPSTLRDHFMNAGLWPWREFKADYFSDRIIDWTLNKRTRGFSVSFPSPPHL